MHRGIVGSRDGPTSDDARRGLPAGPRSAPALSLPVDAVSGDLAAALADGGAAVLVAEPGAGKSTRIPLALRSAGTPGGGRIVVVQPRRVAADAVAARLAAGTGRPLGQVVGLRRRGRTVSGPGVEIEVVTDGVLLAMLGDDPTLDGVGTVVLDEVHERGVTADVCLALVAHVRRELRPDLGVLAMSATVDAAAVAGVLGTARTFEVAGRTHPVEIRHRRPDGSGPVGSVAAAVADALDAVDGDVLVFLPGAREIAMVARQLERALPPGRGVEVRTLHGRASAREQDAALRSPAGGVRAVILSTSLAQTSLTVPGVRAVVDSGLRRTSRTDPATGLPRLVTLPASRATADQRAGRAGRVAPGIAIRCWSPTEDATRPAEDDPEILHADLAPTVLALAAAGVASVDELPWWTPPPPTSWAGARALLQSLGALDDAGRLTEQGRAFAELGLHPRLAAAAGASGPGDPTGAAVAALLEEGLLPGDPADLRAAVVLALDPGASDAPEHRARATRLRSQLTERAGTADAARIRTEEIGLVLARAYPERLAVREPTRAGAFRLGGDVVLELARGADSLAGARVLAVAELDADRRSGRIHHAAPVEPDALAALWPDRVVVDAAAVAEGTGAALVVEVHERRVLSGAAGALPLTTRRRRPEAAEAVAAVLDAVRTRGLGVLGALSDAVDELRARIAAVASVDPTWPDVGDAALVGAVDEWLGPVLPGGNARQPLDGVDLGAAIAAWAAGGRRHELDRLAPTSVALASGRSPRLDWRRGAERGEHRPVLSVRVQDAFGTATTPRVLGGRVPVVVELLSPANRPVAVTDDLARFWTHGYPEVRTALRGRYPRHAWPERP